MKKRPLGISILSWICYLAVFLNLILAGISFFKNSLFQKIPGFSIDHSAQGFFVFIGITFILLAVALFFVGRGIRKANNYARWTFVGISVLMVIGGVFSIFERSYVSIINLLFNLGIILYLTLNKKVKSFFKK